MDTSQVLPQVPLKVKEDLTMEVKPIRILDESEKDFINKKDPYGESTMEKFSSRGRNLGKEIRDEKEIS
jgi:hypothetical protein